MTKEQKKKLHSIALEKGVRDMVAKLIVECPYEFMKEKIQELDTDNLEKTNFYHKHFGKFYLKESVLKHIKKNGRKK